MSVENNDLHALAQSYYEGEVSYESYRRARTQLLDGLPQVSAGGGGPGASETTATRSPVMPSPHQRSNAAEAPGSRYQRRISWMLLVLAIALFTGLITWGFKSGLIQLVTRFDVDTILAFDIDMMKELNQHLKV